MVNAATAPIRGQILVNIDDISMLKDIKKAISMLKGVGKLLNGVQLDESIMLTYSQETARVNGSVTFARTGCLYGKFTNKRLFLSC